jgi:hypothetical protein
VAECLAAFVQDLTALLNRYSVENDSNTPDFILAEYLLKCLETWNATVTHRDKWYGRGFTDESANRMARGKAESAETFFGGAVIETSGKPRRSGRGGRGGWCQ